MSIIDASSHLRVSNDIICCPMYFQTDSSDESDCSGIETSSAAGFFPIHPGRK